jgi:hypothetical protein
MARWRVEIIRGGRSEYFGTVEAPSQREAYRLAIEKFDIPIERTEPTLCRKARRQGRWIGTAPLFCTAQPRRISPRKTKQTSGFINFARVKPHDVRKS